MKKFYFTFLVSLLCFTFTNSQTKVTIITDSIYSQNLKSYSKFNVVLPPNYYTSDDRYITIYLLHGYGGDYNDWVKRANLSYYAKQYNFIIVTPNGQNSWYVNSVEKKNSNYEDYIIKDLIPHIGNNYRVIDTRHGRVIAGLSMGGYGAIRLGIKYANSFFYAAGFSGAFHIIERIREEKDTSSTLIKESMKIFGATENNLWKDADIYTLLEKANKISLPYLYISCGKDDSQPLLESNRTLIQVLQEKKVLYEYHELPGVHNWVYWEKGISDLLFKLSNFDNLKP
jgi:S-formylglutathione hydrolase FrmB